MMYENIAKAIEMVIEEQIELEFLELRGSGEPQYKITMIDGEAVPDDVVILASLMKTFSFMSATRTYIPIDTSDYHGKLEVFYCKKKKGMFSKESLKTINSVRKSYHITALENGEEAKVSLKELMGK